MTACTAALALLLLAPADVDPDLLAAIRAIRAFDNHSHIPPLAPPEKLALPADGTIGTSQFPYPVRLRPESPEWSRAWSALYGATAADTPADVLRRKQDLMRQRGERWPESILDAVAVETALVNAPALGAGHAAARFRFVPHGNALLSPFGLAKPPAKAPPASLALYVSEVLRPAVQKWRSEGAAAIKLSVAYGRSLDFKSVDEADAARVYARGVKPAPAEYTLLQDYLFRVLAREAGAAGLPLHIHVGIGADPWFRIAGSNPLLLEDAVNALRDTKFVLIHGGWPFDRQAGAMLLKPNLWADFSAQTFLRTPRALGETLREWLMWYPDKVLFGTDAYPDPGMPLAGWEELLWLANDTARQALAFALTSLMNDGMITRERALVLARMVLRDNARALYGTGAP